jgi:hypothetical protein
MRIEQRYSQLTETTVHLVAVDIAKFLHEAGHVPQGFSLMEMECDEEHGTVSLRFCRKIEQQGVHESSAVGKSDGTK